MNINLKNDLTINKVFISELISVLGHFLTKVTIINKKTIVLTLKTHDSLKLISLFLKKLTIFRYSILSDIAATDLLNWKSDSVKKQINRFNLSYSLLSLLNENRILLKFNLLSDIALVPSLESIFKSANWLEREVWDMFGIVFLNHPDLRRILTDYGFSGYPLRKDFPLVGFIEVRYDDEYKRIVYELIEMSQEFRVYNFLSPWDQANLNKECHLQYF